MSVAVGGTPPLSYQWFFNGAPLANATSSALTLSGVTTNQAGVYAVEVTNLYGAALSSNATLVARVASTTLFDGFDPGIDLSQWSGFGGTVLATNYGGCVSAPNSLWFGGSGSRYAATQPLNTSAGGFARFELRIASGASNTWNGLSPPYSPIVLEYTNSNTLGGWVQIGSFGGTIYLAWTNIYLALPTRAQAALTQFRWRQLYTRGVNYDHWALDDVQVNADPAPAFVTQPQSQNAIEGDVVTLSAVVRGLAPFSYQWQFNGSNLVGATSGALTLSDVQPGQAGVYTLLLTNSIGFAASSNATLVVHPVPSCAPAPSGLVSWWSGEGNANDNEGLNQGALQNGAAFAPGRVGRAFHFDGVSGSVVVPDSASLRLTNQITIECWINAQSVVGDQSLVAKVGGSGGNNGYQLLLSGTTLIAQFNGPGQAWPGYRVQSGVPIVAGVWNHIAWTYDQSALKLYWNGAPVATNVIGACAIAPSASNLRLSGDDNNHVYFNGLIDEASLYHEALSSDQVLAIYGARGAGKCGLAPAFVSQPQSQTVQVGATASFAAGVAGAQPIAYQWAVNGANIPWATNTSLVLSNAQFSDAGAYSLTVSNSVGALVSANALLRVDFAPALVEAVGGAAVGGGIVTVPVVLAANGNEAALGFTLNFDPLLLTYSGASLGEGAAGAAFVINTNQVGAGLLGVDVALSDGLTFPPGARSVAKVSFTVAALTNASSTTIGFGGQLTACQLSDAFANSLPVVFTNGMLAIAAAGLEGDVSPRPNGDEAVTVTDWVQAGRFAARLDYPTNSSEFQRADCAPRSTLGDGAITVSDWVQVGRYAAGLDPLTPVGGPTNEVIGPGVLAEERSRPKGLSRALQVMDAAWLQGQGGSVYVGLAAAGNENALGFTLSFDPSVFSCTAVRVTGAASGAAFNVNTNQSASGRLGVVLALAWGSSFASGATQIVRVDFAASPSASGAYAMALTDQLVPREVVDAAANALTTSFINGTVTVHSPPALSITLSNPVILLSWPLWATNFSVQEAVDHFSSTIAWSAVGGVPARGSNANLLALPWSPTNAIYRLRQP